MKVQALAKYGSDAASTRQRILQYRAPLAEAGIQLQCEALLGNDYVRSLSSGHSASKVRIVASYAKRMRALLAGPRADAYWIYADLFPYLPPIFDRLLFRLKRPVIVDWDDAFFHRYAEHPSPVVRAILGRKLDHLLARADAITCGNRYLYDHVERFGVRRLLIPTVVHTDKVRPAGGGNREVPVIGWIGSSSTWPYVRPYLPLLRKIVERGDARMLVVGAGHAARRDEAGWIEFRDWSEARETTDLQDMDIGIMPLPDDPWERGKSGYKLIQYMACGLPCVASPVGANCDIVIPERTGYLAASSCEWETALATLLGNRDQARRMGEEGRKRAIDSFSLSSQAPRLIELFRSL